MEPLPPFDELKWLAKHDPEALNQLQEQVTQKTIATAPQYHQHRLMCIQHNLMLRLNRCHNSRDRSYLAMTILTEKLNYLSAVIEQAGTNNLPACVMKLKSI
ncbi:DUF3135 domain-containing protein [uncultured Shewanella sp.]|uniref:DUF3135 domain-containing protein n=1 Tax=uncultured Shewanella sp. TaxID=173975 RepID=UPI0026200C05|nr:DUF3135 domain-containing protein [uncultured Shewanella sp.]